jgi:glucosylceramidase
VLLVLTSGVGSLVMPAGASGRVQMGALAVLTTSDLSSRMSRVAELRPTTRPPRSAAIIRVRDRARFQRFRGLGAAMTDTSAWLIYDRLAASTRGAVIRSLFGQSGIRLDWLHVPIGASDYVASGTPYSYDDLPSGQSDPRLAHFSIGHDLPYILPALRAVRATNPHLKILASPWSAPGWMKRNGRLDNLGHTGTLLASSYAPFARYFVKFLQAYQRHGVSVDAITAENEPHVAVGYPGMELSEPAEARFIAAYLVPALRAAKLHPVIYGYDASWSAFPWPLLSSSAGPYLGGVAWHCYVNDPSWMSRFHVRAPRLDQTVDECSPSIRPLPVPEVLISSLRNWANSVSLWNVALDPQGGPAEGTHGGCPGCTGLVTIDEQSGKVTYDLSYYQLGQVSKFVQLGAVRLSSDNFVRYGYALNTNIASPGLDDVAFANPDGTKVLVAYNNATTTLPFTVQTDQGYVSYRLAPAAMVTLVWDRRA